MREEVRGGPTASMQSILVCFTAPADSAEAAAKHSHTFDIFKKRSQRKSTEGGRSGVPLLGRTPRKRTLWWLTKLHRGSLEVPACFQPFDTSKQLQSGIAVLKLILHSDKVDRVEEAAKRIPERGIHEVLLQPPITGHLGNATIPKTTDWQRIGANFRLQWDGRLPSFFGAVFSQVQPRITADLSGVRIIKVLPGRSGYLLLSGTPLSL